MIILTETQQLRQDKHWEVSRINWDVQVPLSVPFGRFSLVCPRVPLLRPRAYQPQIRIDRSSDIIHFTAVSSSHSSPSHFSLTLLTLNTITISIHSELPKYVSIIAGDWSAKASSGTMSFDQGSPGFLKDFDAGTSVQCSMRSGTITGPPEPDLAVPHRNPKGSPSLASGQWQDDGSEIENNPVLTIDPVQGKALVDPALTWNLDTSRTAPLNEALINYCLWPGCRSTQNFLTSIDLDFHFQTDHLRQCPWPTCNIQRSFCRRSDLLRHMESVHSGARRFICDHLGCHKAYSRKDKLTAHKRSHVQAWPPSSLCSRPNDHRVGIAMFCNVDWSGSPLVLGPLQAMKTNSLPLPSSDMDSTFQTTYIPDSGDFQFACHSQSLMCEEKPSLLTSL